MMDWLTRILGRGEPRRAAQVSEQRAAQAPEEPRLVGLVILTGKGAAQAAEEPSQDLQPLAIVYQTVSASLASVNQTRWSLISNYLLANSFLLVAWAALFAALPDSNAKGYLLFSLGVLGVAISLLWWHLARWINPYVSMGHTAGEAAERKLLASLLVSKCEKQGPDVEQAQGDYCRRLPDGRKTCAALADCPRVFERAWHYQNNKPLIYD